MSSRAVGDVVAGKYALLRELGRGGAGAVYEARHLPTGVRYALKLLHPEPGRDGAARLLREARALARLSHPAVVRLVDFDVCDDGVYLVEELLEGRTLRALLDEELVLSAERALALLLPVLSALGHAHARGVVHRDVKPENIVVCEGAGALRAVLVDFGVAREPAGPAGLTRQGAVVGTPRYMSPEQAWGRDDVDARTDLWSFGAVLYECLAGAPPYDGENDRAVLASIVAADPPHLRAAGVAVDDAIADAVMLALTRAPEARCPSAEALETALLGRPEPPRRASVATRRLLALVAGVALVGALTRVRPRDPARVVAPTPPPAVRVDRAEVVPTDASVPAPTVDAALPRVVRAPWYRRPRRIRDASVPRGTNGAPIVDDL